MAAMQTIKPEQAAELVRKGAILVDVREGDERAREHIPGSRHRAISRLGGKDAVGTQGEILIFHCRSGMRTQANAERLAGAAPCQAYILEGGLEGWKKAGLPVQLDRKQPIEIMRQVQIAAGALVLAGIVLGFAVHPGFFFLAGTVGAGLMTAGLTGFCGMAKLLALMPWNRRDDSRAASTA